jgi:hypothetical protein
VYELQGKDFEGLESYEECLPVVREKLKGRMKWVWGHDLESGYVEARERAGLGLREKGKEEVLGSVKSGNGMSEKVVNGVSVTEIEA